MTFTIIAASLFALQAAPQAADAAKQEAKAKADPEIEVVETKPVKITDKSHPDYVRCKRESVIGSRARKRKVCKSNKEWVADSRKGNQHTRELVEANSPGFNSGG